MNLKRILLSLTVSIVCLVLFIGCMSYFSDDKKIAYQFTVNDEAWFAVKDKQELEKMIEDYKSQYLSNVDKKANIIHADFIGKVEIKEVKTPIEQVINLEEARKIIYAKEKEPVYIEVQKGDSFWSIAKDHSISVTDIEMLNPNIVDEKIYPGDKLVIEPFKPVLGVIMKIENTVVESIPFETEFQKDDSISQNRKVTEKEGSEGKKEVTYNIELINGHESSVAIINEKILEAPVPRVVKVGTKLAVAVSRDSTETNYRVVQGKRVTSDYGWRTHPITGRKSYHDGVDIAASFGSGVYAYDEGKVVQAGWNGAYGISVLIEHKTGIETRYAHMSKIYVKEGQGVKAGERIGAVGSTGDSTGPHLHFEVIKGDKTSNPWNYL